MPSDLISPFLRSRHFFIPKPHSLHKTCISCMRPLTRYIAFPCIQKYLWKYSPSSIYVHAIQVRLSSSSTVLASVGFYLLLSVNNQKICCAQLQHKVIILHVHKYQILTKIIKMLMHTNKMDEAIFTYTNLFWILGLPWNN